MSTLHDESRLAGSFPIHTAIEAVTLLRRPRPRGDAAISGEGEGRGAMDKFRWQYVRLKADVCLALIASAAGIRNLVEQSPD